MSRNYPNPILILPLTIRLGRIFFFIMVARNAFVILILTIAAWLYCRHRKTASGYPIKILQNVPRGFQDVGLVTIDPGLVKALAPQLPVATIILLLEHIAIAKCMFKRTYAENSTHVHPQRLVE